MNSRTVSRRVVIAAGAGAGVLALTGCGTASSKSGKAATAGGDDAFTLYPSARRRAAPRLSGRTISGGHLDLDRWRGKVVVLNVWGSWCAPCRAEAPGLRRVAEETKRLGVEFAGIDIRDNDPAALAFEQEFKIRYPSFADSDGRLTSRFTGIIPLSAVPSTVIIDRRWRIAARIVGPTSYRTLDAVVTQIAKESADEPAKETTKESAQDKGAAR